MDCEKYITLQISEQSSTHFYDNQKSSSIEAIMREHEFSGTHTAFPFSRVDECASATYLRALIANSPIAIVALDAQHRFTMCNPAFEKLFQYTSKELSSADLDHL